MGQRYKLILASRQVYREIKLSQTTQKIIVGTGVEADVRFRESDFFEPFLFTVTREADGWQVECEENLYISAGDVRKLMMLRLKTGDAFAVKYRVSGAEVFVAKLMLDFDDTAKKYDRIVDFSRMNELLIGGGQGNNIRLNHKTTLKDSISIQNQGGKYYLQVNSIGYGTLHNGNAVHSRVVLYPKDFIAIGPYSFCFDNGRLYMDKDDECVFVSVQYQDICESRSSHVYPKFNKSTRIKEVLNNEKIKILEPPMPVKEPKRNIVAQLFPAVAMLLVVVLLRGVMDSAGIGFIITSVASMGIGIVTSVMNIISENKRYKEDVQKRIDTYNRYIEEKKQFIDTCRAQEAAILENRHYSVEKELQIVHGFLPQLFERDEKDDDFLEVRLGTGEREAFRKVDYKPQERLEALDELQKIPSEVAEEYKIIQNVPVTLKLDQISQLGISGKREDLYNMLKVLTLDLATRQYYSDVQFLYCIDDEEQRQFEWLRMLPHVQNEYLNRRNIICDDESKNILLEYLYKELTVRNNNSAMPRLVVFIYRDRGIQKHPISEMIKDSADKGVTFIYFNEYEEFLPEGCENIIRLEEGNRGIKIDSCDGTKAEKFQVYKLTDNAIAAAVRKLAPVYCEEITLESSLTKSITFFELLGIYDPQDVNLNHTWSTSEVYRTMAAPLGVKSKNQMISLDLHEKAHGPHGLVAGTTGSGKSEILQTYILSMALKYHPYDVGFVIIDFKGGGMVNQFRKLPHLVGAITNIDGREIDRSLLSIRAELKKRQELFAQYEVNHIDAYIKLFKQGKAHVPLPHLIVIVDEFAELKMEQPEFMKELISAARIGRSLGVHLILATQKPSGVVDPQIWSNSRFRLCLKVQSKEDSNEVIKTPLAAEITEPGRAYLQVGNNEIFELFQSGYSGSPSKIEGAITKKEFQISRLNLSGKRTVIYEQKRAKSSGSEETQLDSVVHYVAEHCDKNHIERLPFICLPSLPTLLQAEKEMAGADVQNGLFANIGMYDDPSRQYQGVFAMNVTLANTMIIGSAQNGKTNLLQCILRSLTEKYTPDELNVYIMDFGSMIFRNYEALHHVGGVVCSYEDEKCKNLFKMLDQEVKIRKEKLANAGVGSYASYLEAGLHDMPQIVVMIDNITALKELYLMDNDYLLPLCREGITVGISFVVANAQTSGIGYKYLSNFAQRIGLYCNDSTEYGALFDSCRMRPFNTPGRCLVEKNKTIYESQTYLAFDGEKEIDRVRQILHYVQDRNQACPGRFAKPIPVVPKDLTVKILNERFRCVSDMDKLAVGLDYESVSPKTIDWTNQGVLALTGKDSHGKAAFAQYMLQSLLDNDAKVYIIDNMAGVFGYAQYDAEIYSKSLDETADILQEIEVQLESRYRKAAENAEYLENAVPIVLLIQNPDIITAISGDRKMLASYKNILGKYKGLKACIIYTDLENSNIAYNAPELLKMMKENRQFLMFENITNIKLVDIPTTLIKKFKKPLETNEAFLLTNNVLYKMKVVTQE